MFVGRRFVLEKVLMNSRCYQCKCIIITICIQYNMISLYKSTVHISVVSLCTYCILQTKRSYKDGIVAILHILYSYKPQKTIISCLSENKIVW